MASPALIVEELDDPTLQHGAPTSVGWSAFAGVSLDAAVNLTEDRRFRDVPLAERLALAVREQQAFLNSLLNPANQAVFDLRLVRDPGDSSLKVGVLVRALGATAEDVARRATELAGLIDVSAPDHVLTSVIADDDLQRLTELRDPLRAGVGGAAFITREEVIARPTRPDLRRRYEYLYSVVPFGSGIVDWAPFYRLLMRCTTRTAVSVALHPRASPRMLVDSLGEYATVYGQLAQSDRGQPGVFSGEETLPAEAFAVDAAAVFGEYRQRLDRRHFAMRILVASEKALPAGLAEGLGALIAPSSATSMGQRPSGGAGYALRQSSDGAAVARWDLHAADLILPSGPREVWGRPDPPPEGLADLPAIGDAQDAAAAFRLPVAVAGDLFGIRVRRGRSGPSEGHVRARSEAINLGALSDGASALSIDVNALSKHALVAGSTGSGKTSMVLEILRQLWPAKGAGRRRVPFLVIEPVNDIADDYRRLFQLPELGDDLTLYTVGDERLRPLRFNPFAVPDGVLVAEHMAAMLAAFRAAFGLFDPLPAIYEEAIAATYARRGILPGETASPDDAVWPTVTDFSLAMADATAGLGYSGEVKANLEAASVIRAKQLANGPCGSVFRTDSALDVEGMLRTPTIVELKALGGAEEQALVIALLLNAITASYRAKRGAQTDLQHVTIIEEAHRLLARAGNNTSAQAQAREQAAASFAAVLAENRKYGEGIIIAEQIPTKLVDDAVKNTNLKVMCRLTAEEEREYLGQSMAMSPEQRLAAARLRVGEAMIYSDEMTYTAEVLAPYTLRSVVELREVDEFAPASREPPFAVCEVCAAQCAWRASGLALSRRPRLVATRDEFIEGLRPRPSGVDSAGELDTPLGMSARLASEVVSEVGRYRRAKEPQARTDLAVCTVVHLLESRVHNPEWIRRCAEQAVRTAAAR